MINKILTNPIIAIRMEYSITAHGFVFQRALSPIETKMISHKYPKAPTSPSGMGSEREKEDFTTALVPFPKNGSQTVEKT